MVKQGSSLELVLQAADCLITLAIEEDIGSGDVTSTAILPGEPTLQGRFTIKAEGVVAGLPLVERIFQRVVPEARFQALIPDGSRVLPGDLVAIVTGPGVGLLACERSALNFLQRLSGIASLTRRFVDAVSGTGAVILDTRKTHPGYRILEKYAVRMGGAQNHRMGLFDMALVKDNHISAAGSLGEAVRRVWEAHPELVIEVEVSTQEQLEEALGLEVNRIMLDNMTLDQMRNAVQTVSGRIPLEASGNVTLERVAEIAATGVDYISVGALTHSAPALDISMKVSLVANGENR